MELNIKPRELNIKPRLVTCIRCRYDVTTDAPAPKCPHCTGSLVVVCYSLLTGRRLTGAPSTWASLGLSPSLVFGGMKT